MAGSGLPGEPNSKMPTVSNSEGVMDQGMKLPRLAGTQQMVAGHPVARGSRISARFSEWPRSWQRRRSAEAEFATMTYLDRKDLGFPTEFIFHPDSALGSDAARPRRPALRSHWLLGIEVLLGTIVILLGYFVAGS